MPHWSPGRIWRGDDAYIVGGGPSLAGFDWGSIAGKNVIGCNSAFILGAEVVKVVIFGDYAWWLNIGKSGKAGEDPSTPAGQGLPSFGGLVVSCCSKLHEDETQWLLKMPRSNYAGLGTGRELGWNGNTGSIAVNLALIFGARRVFLLGFDMEPGADDGPRPKKLNWHDVRYEKGNADRYSEFCSGFKRVALELPNKFPGSSIVNVTDRSSLDAFPKQSLAEHFARARESVGVS